MKKLLFGLVLVLIGFNITLSSENLLTFLEDAFANEELQEYDFGPYDYVKGGYILDEKLIFSYIRDGK